MANVYAVVGDLFFAERLGMGLERLGHQATVVDLSAQPLPDSLPEGVDLTLVDLEGGSPALAAIRAARAAGVPILAFGPHVDLPLREAALAAGADRVVAKSKLTNSLPDLVAEMVAKYPHGGGM